MEGFREEDVRNLRSCLADALGVAVTESLIFSCALLLAARGKVGRTGEVVLGLFHPANPSGVFPAGDKATIAGGRSHDVRQSFDRTSHPFGSAQKLSKFPRGTAGDRVIRGKFAEQLRFSVGTHTILAR